MDDPSSDSAEMAIPKSESTYSIDIPNSICIWSVNPRPAQSSDVSNQLFRNERKGNVF